MKEKVLIIPGNPSAEVIYTNWLKTLENDFKSFDFELLLLPKIDNTFSQLDHVINYYQEIISKRPSPVIVIGHSIGGYFASQVFKENPEQLKKLILIFPYFGHENIAGKLLLKTAQYLTTRPRTMKLLTSLKPFIDRYYAPSSLVNEQELTDSLRLAKLEKDHFKSLKNQCISHLGNDRIEFIYTRKDNWCTKKTVDEVSKIKSTHFLDTIHDFVISPLEMAKMNRFLKESKILE